MLTRDTLTAGRLSSNAISGRLPDHMLFRRFYDDALAQASYLIGCERTGEAIVVDPNLDTSQYVRAAGAERVRITQVTETHIHADFLSGVAPLTTATGSRLNLSAEGGEQYGYSREVLAKSNALKNGSRIVVGDVVLEALHTPGHTPEHMSFIVSDGARGEVPVAALTGDFVFVGDVGRPDLLERAAGASGTTELSARQLYTSIRTFSSLADHLQIWPGHGAGSACGKQLGAMPLSTLGYEKIFNWAFNCSSEEEFVRRVLEDQPVPPRYFGVMKKLNRELADVAGSSNPVALSLRELEQLIDGGAFVIDTRPKERFAAGHIPGTLNVPFNRSFLNWCGCLVPYDRPLVMIIDSEAEDPSELVCSTLRKIGLVEIAGFAGPGIIREYRAKGNQLAKMRALTVTALHDALPDASLQVVDVRGPDEWRKGHLPNALNLPLAALPDRLGELDRTRPTVVQCLGGSRSAIATSFLEMSGWTDVSDLVGGYEHWVESGFETVSE